MAVKHEKCACDNPKCKSCRYHCYITSMDKYSSVITCDYILKVGTHRPCSIENCTVYEPIKRKNKHKYNRVIKHEKGEKK